MKAGNGSELTSRAIPGWCRDTVEWHYVAPGPDAVSNQLSAAVGAVSPSIRPATASGTVTDNSVIVAMP